MAGPLSTRPISSVRDQQTSPQPPSSNGTPHLKSEKLASSDPSPRVQAILGTPSDRSAPTLSSDDRHSSPFVPSARSSEYSFDRTSTTSFGHRSASTAATSSASHDPDRLPSIAALDFPKSDRFVHPSSAWTHSHPNAMHNAAEPADPSAPRRAASPPPPSIRRGTSPAGRVSNHSAEWDMRSDRGSPLVGARRPGVPPPASSASASAAPAGAVHSAYSRDFARSPLPSYRDDRDFGRSPVTSHRDSAYRDQPHAAHRELSPPLNLPLKRKVSISSDAGSRRPDADRMIDRGTWSRADYAAHSAYPDTGYYRNRDRAESPERTYSSSYSRDAAYSARHIDQRIDDKRYSPRHAHPTSPSSSRIAYRGYDAGAPAASQYHSRRISGRYSPSPRSPSYAPRQALVAPPAGAVAPPAHDPYSRSAPHSSYARRSPPPFAADPRPQLPPLSSRAAAPSRYADPRARYTPPLEAVHAERLSPTPEPHAYSEPFYPDRRLYFARERIQDPEMDDYYHGPVGSVGSRGRYADYAYDPYGSPHAAPYAGHVGKPGNGAAPMPIPSPGMAPMAAHPGARHHDGRLAYASPYGPGDYMGHDPRDMHAHAGMGRPGGAMGRPMMAMPATHVPPGPSAGIAPPPRRRGKLPKPVTDLLKSWLLEHASHPYPTEDEKRSLCSMTGLTLSQVSNWFINARRRILLPTGANGSPGGTTAAQVKAAFSADSPSPPPHEA